MLRAEPWETPSTLHEMQQQLKTLNDENKQQWYDRAQHTAGVPPLWLGFYDPAAPARECTDCDVPDCVDYTFAEVVYTCPEGGTGVNRGPHVVRVPRETLEQMCLNVPDFRTLILSDGDGGGSYFVMILGHTAKDKWRIQIQISSWNSPGSVNGNCYEEAFYEADNCLGPFTLATSSDDAHQHLTFPATITVNTAIADCGDPPPTPTSTGTGTGSGTGTPECGAEDNYEWSQGPYPSRGWYALTYNCAESGGCRQLPPTRDGTFNGEVATGICVPL